MSENKGNQYVKPDSTPSEEHTEEPQTRDRSRKEIIEGAREEGQLDGFKPDPETEKSIGSQPASHVEDGSEEGGGEEKRARD